jgi:hypothetical protein
MTPVTGLWRSARVYMQRACQLSDENKHALDEFSAGKVLDNIQAMQRLYEEMQELGIGANMKDVSILVNRIHQRLRTIVSVVAVTTQPKPPPSRFVVEEMTDDDSDGGVDDQYEEHKVVFTREPPAQPASSTPPSMHPVCKVMMLGNSNGWAKEAGDVQEKLGRMRAIADAMRKSVQRAMAVSESLDSSS